MRRTILATIIPPLAVCRYGCAGCCAAPIGVFWLTALGLIGYSLFSGAVAAEGVHWPIFGLGVLLWLLAIVWAELTIKGVARDQAEKDKCGTRSTSTVCRIVRPQVDESDPFDEVRKCQ